MSIHLRAAGRRAALKRDRDTARAANRRLRQRNIILAEQLGTTTVQLQAADDRIALLQQQAGRAAGAEKRAAAAEAKLAELGAIPVPPMVRDTSAPEDQATAPHGVRTVNGPAEVMPLAEAARRGHFGSAADTLPLRQVDPRDGPTENDDTGPAPAA